MKVLTLNAWGAYGPPERRPTLREALLQVDADILLLQEANVPGLLDSLPYPTRLHSPETGLAILSRFPLRAEHRLMYVARSSLEPHLFRGALFAQLDPGGDSVWTATTHLAWKAEDEAARTAQTEELISAARLLPNPALVGGDFNSPPADLPARKMIAAGFTDLYARSCPEKPGITWDNRNPFIQSHSVRFPDRRIDYLFLRGALTLDRCEVACQAPGTGGLYPSDHYGVLALFQP